MKNWGSCLSKSKACLDCQERTLGCHSWCEKYLAFRAERDKELSDRVKSRDHYKLSKVLPRNKF